MDNQCPHVKVEYEYDEDPVDMCGLVRGVHCCDLSLSLGLCPLVAGNLVAPDLCQECGKWRGEDCRYCPMIYHGLQPEEEQDGEIDRSK